VHSDVEIAKNKGPTVLKDEERYAAVEACKWVDEIVRDAPYATQIDILNKHKCVKFVSDSLRSFTFPVLTSVFMGMISFQPAMVPTAMLK